MDGGAVGREQEVANEVEDQEENGHHLGKGEGTHPHRSHAVLAALSRHETDGYIIDAVRRLPCLYDSSCKEYRDLGRTAMAWEEAAELCPGMDTAAVKERWRKLRDAYVKVNKKLGAEAGDEEAQLRTKWPYYEQMSFLSDFVKHRKGKRTYKRSSLDTGADDKKAVRVEYRVEASPIQILQEGEEASMAPKRLVWATDSVSGGGSGAKSRSKQRTRGPDTLELALLESLGQAAKSTATEAPTAASQAAAGQANDEEALFGRMVAATLRRFPPRAKALCKFRIQEVIFEQENQNLSDPAP